MQAASDNRTQQLIMTESEFNNFSSMVDRLLGIKMPISKKVMLESRLQKRVKENKLHSFEEYYKFINSEEGKRIETTEFLNVVTTNKTDFYRESKHFDFLRDRLFPDLLKKGVREVRGWTCASSTGEEPYTIMIEAEEFKLKNPSLNTSLVATDISTRVLSKAKEAIYKESDIYMIPDDVRKRYFLKGKGENSSQYKVKNSLKDKITFGKFNLMSEKYNSVPGPFHFIFCRNVLIYFERKRQEQIIKKLCRCLVPGGVLFLGHSESMAGMNQNMKSLESAVYLKE